MSIANYRAFVKVIEYGSLTKAANELGYSQPGISHMISALESEMGFPLIIRKKGSILPTEDGKKILYYCYQIIRDENSLKDTASSIHGLTTGNINVGSYCSMLTGFVPQVVFKFSQIYANISFFLHEISFAAFPEYFAKGKIDLGFMNEKVPKGYSFIPLFHDAAYVVMRKDHPLASNEKIVPNLLNGCNFIMPQTGFDDVVNSVLDKAPFYPNIKCYVASDVGAIALVSNGLGITVMSSLQVGLLPDGLISRPFTSTFGRDLGIAIKSVNHASPAIKEFVRIAKDTAKQMHFE